MDNVYYSPEKHGLTIFAEVEEDDLCYEFNMFVVWQGKRGGLYYASDVGCSCPSPFEDYTSVEALTPMNGKSGLEAFYTALASWRESTNNNTNTDYLRRKVREYMDKS